MISVQDAFARSVVVRNVYLRAGPDTDYPAIVRLRANSTVKIYGCLEDWYWCDVKSGSYRGWVNGDYIYTTYKRRNVAIIDAGSQLNFPIVNFTIGYWDTHYRSRPFYSERHRWVNYGYRDRGHNWHNRDGQRDNNRDDHRDNDRDRDDRRWNDRDDRHDRKEDRRR